MKEGIILMGVAALIIIGVLVLTFKSPNDFDRPYTEELKEWWTTTLEREDRPASDDYVIGLFGITALSWILAIPVSFLREGRMLKVVIGGIAIVSTLLSVAVFLAA